jgi:hypothetical protein
MKLTSETSVSFQEDFRDSISEIRLNGYSGFSGRFIF